MVLYQKGESELIWGILRIRQGKGPKLSDGDREH